MRRRVERPPLPAAPVMPAWAIRFAPQGRAPPAVGLDSSVVLKSDARRPVSPARRPEPAEPAEDRDSLAAADPTAPPAISAAAPAPLWPAAAPARPPPNA